MVIENSVNENESTLYSAQNGFEKENTVVSLNTQSLKIESKLDNKILALANKITEIVEKNNVFINEPMSKHTSFKVGGNADIFVKVDSEQKLRKLLDLSEIKNKVISLTIVGNGSNLIVKDNGIRGVVIKYTASKYEIENYNDIKFNKIKNDKNIQFNEAKNDKDIQFNEIENYNDIKYQKNAFCVKVDAGISNASLANTLLENDLSGFEFASGIPGTVGGAIVMNAGAYGSEMQDIVIDVTYIDLVDNKIKTIKNPNIKIINHNGIDYTEDKSIKNYNKDIEIQDGEEIKDDKNCSVIQCNFAYRNSIFQNELKDSIIISTNLKLTKSNKENIKNKMEEYKSKRIASQPLDKPSAGSTFKRGTDFITAQLIDEAGLKGYKIGGAQVSQKHAGFIVNIGNATAKDIIDLIKYVQEKVYEKFGKKIEAEVRIIGE